MGALRDLPDCLRVRACEYRPNEALRRVKFLPFRADLPSPSPNRSHSMDVAGRHWAPALLRVCNAAATKRPARPPALPRPRNAQAPHAVVIPFARRSRVQLAEVVKVDSISLARAQRRESRDHGYAEGQAAYGQRDVARAG